MDDILFAEKILVLKGIEKFLVIAQFPSFRNIWKRIEKWTELLKLSPKQNAKKNNLINGIIFCKVNMIEHPKFFAVARKKAADNEWKRLVISPSKPIYH